LTLAKCADAGGSRWGRKVILRADRQAALAGPCTDVGKRVENLVDNTLTAVEGLAEFPGSACSRARLSKNALKLRHLQRRDLEPMGRRPTNWE